MDSVARTLHAYHDATAGFIVPPDAVWQRPPQQPTEVICHNDFGPYNLLFEGAELTGVIEPWVEQTRKDSHQRRDPRVARCHLHEEEPSRARRLSRGS